MAELSLPAQLKKRDRPRISAYATNLSFYNGNQWLTSTVRQPRRITLNYCKTILHKVTADVLKGRTITVTPTDDSDAALTFADEAETALAQVHEQNALDQLDFDTELDAAVLGDGAYKVWWDDRDGMIRVSAPDPSGIWAWTLPDDPSRTWRVAQQYKLDADSARSTLTLSAPALTALRTKGDSLITEAWERHTFERWVNDTLDVASPNPYGVIPFVLFPNLREPKKQWGESDIPALIEPQRELNRLVTQLSLIAELSGNPIAVLENVTESTDIAVTPGAVWELPAAAKAYLLDLLKGGGVDLLLKYLDQVYRALHDLGETPRSAFGDVERDLSGVALELELDPLVKKVDRKRLLRREAYQHRTDLVLHLLKLYLKTDYTGALHSVTFGSVLPTDRDRVVKNELAMVGAFVHSRRHAADTLGDINDPDAELLQVLEELTRLAPLTPSQLAPTPAQEAPTP